MSLSVIVLAAGRGVRMCSILPKVLHRLGGIPILSRIIATVSQLGPQKIAVVYGDQGDALKAALPTDHLVWVQQYPPLGTGHAALQALPFVLDTDKVLILYGDIPLITVETLTRLLAALITNDEIGMITTTVADPTGFGRIIRNKDQKLTHIIEEKDATLEQKKIQEINTGFFVVPKKYLEKWLPKLTANNEQQEYYLTDIITLANQEGLSIKTVSPTHEWEITGINDKVQLAALERIYQKTRAIEFMQQGVTLFDPNRFDVRGDLVVGKEVVIDINVIFEGRVIVGNAVKIGPNVLIKDTIIEDGAEILANSVIEGATIGKGCQIGPFARIRPGTQLAEQAKIGNFVEVKNAIMGVKTKVNHLSYIGDATVGNHTNIGAGTITCNFDGKKKHKTIIGNDVFIGSDTQLIAPLTIGDGVTVGAGTTVRKNVSPNYLVHNRVEQRSVENWNKKDKT